MPNLDVMMKVQQWERAKGELRALVQMQGSYVGEKKSQLDKWKSLDRLVTKFIEDVEDEELQY